MTGPSQQDRTWRYIEDMHAGMRFSTGTHALDSRQIIDFAGQFDPQPFHLDPEAARNTMFGGLAASGWHTAAITMKLMVRDGIPLAGGMVGAGIELAWPSPTRPDDILRVEGEVVEISPPRSAGKRGAVTVRCETLNQDNVVVQRLVARLIVLSRPVPEDTSTSS